MHLEDSRSAFPAGRKPLASAFELVALFSGFDSACPSQFGVESYQMARLQGTVTVTWPNSFHQGEEVSSIDFGIDEHLPPQAVKNLQ